jgi:hypothetical protein
MGTVSSSSQNQEFKKEKENNENNNIEFKKDDNNNTMLDERSKIFSIPFDQVIQNQNNKKIYRLSDIYFKKSNFWNLLKYLNDSEYLPKSSKVIVNETNYNNDFCNRKISGHVNTHSQLTKEAVIEQMWLDPVVHIFKDFNMENFVIAGGFITKAIIKAQRSENFYRSMRPWQNSDVDLFLYGINNDEKGFDKAMERVNDVLELVKKHWGAPHVKIIISEYCITFYNDRLHDKIQVILCPYQKPEDIIYDFDLGSVSALWDGQSQDFMFTSHAKFALETRLNIVDLKNYRSSYESRLYKYFSRDFGLLFINFPTSSNEKWLTQFKLKNKDENDHIDLDSIQNYMFEIGELKLKTSFFNFRDRVWYAMSIDKIKQQKQGQAKENESFYANFDFSYNFHSLHYKNYQLLSSGDPKKLKYMVGISSAQEFKSFQDTRRNYLPVRELWENKINIFGKKIDYSSNQSHDYLCTRSIEDYAIKINALLSSYKGVDINKDYFTLKFRTFNDDQDMLDDSTMQHLNHTWFEDFKVEKINV